MEIIPAIDLIDAKCVRLTQGDYAQKKIYNEDPLEVAKAYEDAGIKRLHLVDLDGAKARKIVNYKVLERIASNTNLHVDFGGGLGSDEDLKIAFDSGAKQVTGGSIAVKKPEVFLSWVEKYGAEKIILGADARDRIIAVGGWEEGTGIDLFDFLKDYLSKGLSYVICTDIAKDGMMQGPSVGLYKEMQLTFPKIKLVASGGVSCFEDLKELEAIGVYGTIVGKAFYEGTISLEQLASFSK